MEQREERREKSICPFCVQFELAWEVLEKYCSAELKYLGRISHPNVIKLLGYCEAEKKEATCLDFHRKEANKCYTDYEYVANGCLMSHLFPGKDFEPLSWAQRIKIVTGFTRALVLLHKLHIVHRDVTTCNVLLDSVYMRHLQIYDSGVFNKWRDK